MSKRYVREDGHKPNHRIEFGFDAALDTFYFQVIDVEQSRRADEAAERIEAAIRASVDYDEADARAADNTGLLIWQGTSPEEIKTADELARLMEPYITLDEETKGKLRADQLRDAHPPTQLQRMMRDLITGSQT